MKKLISILKGAAIGVANIVAGLSGGTAAILCNAYDDLLDIFSNLFTSPIKTIKKHYLLLIGMLLGLAGGVLLLSYLYTNFPLPVAALFCGIVITSSIPLFKSALKDNKINYKNIIAYAISLGFIILIPNLSQGSASADSSLVINSIVFLFVGFICAVALLLPGVSGSMILASFGYYDDMLNLIKGLMERIVHLNFNGILPELVLALFFAIGVLLGLVAAAKAIKLLFKNFKSITDFVVLGLITGSIVSMILVVFLDKNNSYLFESKAIWHYISASVLLITGLAFGYMLSKLNKGENDNVEKFNDDFFNEKAKEYTNEWLKLTTDLVSFKSVLDEFKPNDINPFGEENTKALNYMLDTAKRDGYKTLNQDNYAGHIEMGEGEEILGILAHLDVVPAVGKWTNDPFTATISGDKLIGRGVNDDKGPLAAAYMAMKIVSNMGIKINKRVRLIVGCDEETGSRCLTHYFKFNEMPQSGFSPDACFPCINGEKAACHFDIVGKTDSGIVSLFAGERYNIVPDLCEFKLNKDLDNEFKSFLKENNYNGEIKDGKYITYGISAHAMQPEKGLNAAFIAFEFINKYLPCELSNYVMSYLYNDPYGKKLGIDVYHEEMKSLSLNVGIFRVENGSVKIGCDSRVPVENYDDTIREKLNASLKDTSLKLEFEGCGKIHYVPRKSQLVNTLMSSYQAITNDMKNDAFTIGGGTYAKFIDNCVAFGPQFVGSEDVDHQADEYVNISDYTKVIAIYAKAIYELVK